MHRKHRGEAAGFGLLELLVAITLASIVLLGVGMAQSVCFDLGRTSQETLSASADLEAALEAMRLLSLEELTDPAGPYPPGQPLAAYEGLHLEGERIVVSYPNHTGGIPPDPLEIRLTLSFADHAGRPRSLSLATLATR